MSGLDGVALGGILAFAEAILGVGVVLPGEAAVTAIAATTATSRLPLLLAAVALGAFLSDHLNYGLGRLLGPRLAQSRLVKRIGVHHWNRGVRLVRTHGTASLVVSRLTPVVRTLVPAIAGVSHLPYRTFVLASAVGSSLWSLFWVAAGTLVTSWLGGRTELLAGLLVVGLSVLVVRRVMRHGPSHDAAPPLLGAESRPAASPETDKSGDVPPLLC